MMASSWKGDDRVFIVRISRLSNSTVEEMKYLPRYSFQLSDEVTANSDTVHDSYDIDPSFGRPVPEKKVSTTQVNEEFN